MQQQTLVNGPRLEVQVFFKPDASSTLPDDVARGLASRPKALPPKYFYDARGAELFDKICDTEEYYPTRTEHALLAKAADDIIAAVRPTDIIELGSGAARKTRAIFDAAERAECAPRYVPFDVTEAMLRDSAEQLLSEYSWLRVHGIVGDYDRHLNTLPPGDRRLIMFIGSTIGNFEPEAARKFLSSIAQQMGDGDQFLLGTDLVKENDVLHAAYNDEEGLTAEFNENVLRVINRELDADFELAHFEHLAFFNREKSQIEMHLRSTKKQTVAIEKIGMTVDFDREETILTEVSRKFTRSRVADLLAEAGLELTDWYTPENDYFGLSLSRKKR